MGEILTMDEFLKEEKRRKRKEKLKNGFEKTYKFCVENKEIVIGAVTTLYAGGKMISKNARIKEQKRLKERTIYDRSAGCYYETKKKLSNRQRLEIDRRRINGERIGYILEDMGLLR